ncbi:MAG: hypothetical protein WBS19_20495 [Candidatus Korobacteraceae bacterium]
MGKLKFNTAGINDGILLVGGAGDGDTGGGLYAVDAAASKLIDRVSSAGITLFDDRLARLLRTPLHTGGGEILVYDKRGVSNYLRVDELSDPHYLIWDGQHLIGGVSLPVPSADLHIIAAIKSISRFRGNRPSWGRRWPVKVALG